MPKTKIRYAITCLDKNDLRVMAYANQGRNLSDTAEDAERTILKWRKNSSENVKMLYGEPDTLEVRPVRCYENGDALQTVWNA